MNNTSFNRRPFRDNRQQDEFRVNWQIRVPNVRVVRGEEQLGVMSTDQARRIAQDEGMDLVEIAPTAKPPVCKIMDYSRFKYEQAMKKKDAAKKQRSSAIQLKEIRLRPSIADHDVEVKVNQAKKFLQEHCKVQFNLQFKGHREMSHREQGFAVMQKVVAALEEQGVLDKQPSMEGNRIICIFSPKT